MDSSSFLCSNPLTGPKNLLGPPKIMLEEFGIDVRAVKHD